ncbi:hypothetical protein EOL96_02825 [Candidatus Saccharibacteria bacterium]|nr:hypothetical protein [Candidatus Saccharibacteria bacterium]
MNILKPLLLGITAIALGVTALTASPVSAVTCTTPADCVKKGLPQTGGNTDLTTIIATIVNTLLFILGAVAVIMIVIGGIKYTTSNGDQTAVTSAKNTILYSVIGLIVALLAYAIVNFIVTQFVK